MSVFEKEARSRAISYVNKSYLGVSIYFISYAQVSKEIV